MIQQTISEITNQYINKIEPRINTQMLTGLLNKTLPVFLKMKKFHRPPCMSGWAKLPRPCGSKKAKFHNVGKGGQFCWHLAWLTLNDLIFHLHWNPDSKTRKFLLWKLHTSESHCPPWLFFTEEELVLSIPYMAKLHSFVLIVLLS